MACIRALVMSAYKVINCLISQPKHMLWVLKRTVAMRRFFWAPNYRLNLMCKKNINNFTLNICVYLDYDLYSKQIWYTSVHKSTH